MGGKLTVVFLAGLPGVGKTSLGDLLAAITGGTHLDFDVVGADAVNSLRNADPLLGEAHALKLAKEEMYRALEDKLGAAAVSEKFVVVSAPFTSHLRNAGWWRGTCLRFPGSLMVRLRLDEEERIRRIGKRGEARDLGAGRREDIAPPFDHLLLDSGQPVGVLAVLVLKASGFFGGMVDGGVGSAGRRYLPAQ